MRGGRALTRLGGTPAYQTLSNSEYRAMERYAPAGHGEQDADIVAFIHREELHDKETDKKGIAELHIAKHRNGALGVIPMRFDGITTKFDNLQQYRGMDGY